MILLAIACLAAAELGYRFTTPLNDLHLPVVWAPLGILAGAFLLSNRKRWPAIAAVFAATTLLAGVVLHDRPWPSELWVVCISGAQAWITAVLVQRTIDGPFDLTRVSHIATFALAGLATSTCGAALAPAPFTTGAGTALAAWRAGTMGDMLGLLLVTPATVAIAQGPTEFTTGGSGRRRVETIAAMGAALILMQAIYGDLAPVVVRVPAYVLPLLLWAAFRCKSGDTAIGMVAVCMLGLWHTVEGRGPFTTIGVTAGVLRAQGAGLTMIFSILLLAAVVAERKRAAAERDRLVGDLQQALAEIKTLQGLIPLCAWCHKIRNDAGSWQGLESYLQQHTDATFSHGICPACTSKVEVETLELARTMNDGPGITGAIAVSRVAR